MRVANSRETSRARLALAGALAIFLAGPLAAEPTEENPETALDPDYAAGKTAVEAKDWPTAIARLRSAALRDTRNADIQNYLGYAYRNAGQMDQAFAHYARALQLNPRHRGAHEYVGEAYLLVRNLSKAEEHLAALERICLIPCEERDDLKEKIDAYKAANK